MKNQEFSELLRTHGDIAYRMAFQLTGGREAEAGDLVQEVFLRIWKHWDQPRPVSMKAWMYRVLKNLYLDALRRQARRPAVSLQSLEESDVSWEDILPDGQGSPETVLEKEALQRDVNHAFTLLDEEFRTPVMLCDLEGLAYEDIARIMECPIGTVRSRIHRGRLQLREHLKNWVTPQEVSA